MRFVQFTHNGGLAVGVEICQGGDVIDLTSFHEKFPDNMRDFIDAGSDVMDIAKMAVQSGSSQLPRSDVTLTSPIQPGKVICVGMNYADHCQEMGQTPPTEPVTFSKFPSTVIGPQDDIPYPEETCQLDWEVELTVVVGKEGKHISRDAAMSHVFGYTVAHDVSARDWMKRNGGQVLLGKSMDGFCPLGPAIVTPDEIGDPHKLRLWTKVNGVVKQDGCTQQLIFKIEELVEFLSRFFTLKPGDVILTGTPPGCGVSRKPQEFLKRGDVVEVGIEKIGSCVNNIK